MTLSINQRATVIIVSAWVALCGVQAHAELQATPLPGDARLVEYQYDEDNTYLVYSKPRAVTHVMLPDGETVVTAAAGDTGQWEIRPTGDRRHLFIKPKLAGLSTSLTLISSKRSYQMILRSTGEGGKWYQRVSWAVPEMLLQDLSASQASGSTQSPQQSRSEESGEVGSGDAAELRLNPANLRYGYTIEGDAPFRPTEAFDDGRFVWLRMPDAMQELPVLFVEDAGEIVLANILVKEFASDRPGVAGVRGGKASFIIVQRLAASVVLKIGEKEVRVRREAKSGFLGFGGR